MLTDPLPADEELVLLDHSDSNRTEKARLLKSLRSPLARRLIGQTILFSSIITLILSSIQIHGDYVSDIRAANQTIEEVKSSRVKSIIESVWVIDDIHIQTQLDGIAQLKDIQAVAIFSNGELGWHSGDFDQNQEAHRIPLIKVDHDDRFSLGELVLVTNMEAIYRRLVDNVLVTVGSNALKTLLVACFFFATFYHIVGAHLVRLSEYTSKYKPGVSLEPFDIGTARQTDSDANELYVLAHAINTLIKNNEDFRRERAAIEALTVKQRDELAETNKQLKEFTYRASHDLRAPIVSSVSLLELTQNLLDEGDSDAAKPSVQLAHRSLTTLRELIDNLIEITALKRREEEVVEIDLCEEIRACTQCLSHLPDFDRLDIRVQIDPALRVATKASQLRTVLENLISNAIKYQDPGESHSYVSLAARTEASTLTIEVCDNGLGIPADKEGQLFSMFKRFHTKVAFGSGLGMYLVRECVESLGGVVRYVRPEKGCCFVVEIPQGEQL